MIGEGKVLLIVQRLEWWSYRQRSENDSTLQDALPRRGHGTIVERSRPSWTGRIN